MRRFLLVLVLALVALPLAHAFVGARGDTPAKTPPSDAAGQARVLLDQKDFAGAAKLLQQELEHAPGDATSHEMLGTALLQLGRNDEAAHWLDAAMRRYEIEGKADKAKALAALVHRADPFADRRAAFLRKLVDTLFAAAEGLVKAGHAQRAMGILGRILPAAPSAKDAQRIEDLLADVKSQFEQVQLDEGHKEKPASGEWPLYEHETDEYRLACNLEPDVAKRVGTLMDDLHRFYVQVYFDGDARKAAGPKPLIRIFPDEKQMLAEWQGGGGTKPGGWWSPGENEVRAFDTRTSGAGGGTLDMMLMTLFHEASHQFMSLLSKGGYTPAWLNEGTASFFEGTTAMADGKVLWPGAAHMRLDSLVGELQSGKPTARETIEYAGAGSYGPEFYAFGWGLCYFLQQYEDPKTLKYVYRPLYAEYRSKIIKRGAEPMKVFEEVFLGKNSPLGHQTFEDFERDWRKWIVDTVKPLEGSNAATRKLRLERSDRYLAAALGAKGKAKGDVTEDELLRRALGDIEYVRSHIDREDAPDGDLLVKQADLLERLKRDAAAAPLLEKALDLADSGKYEIAPQRYADIEKNLAKIDRGNAALRGVRSTAASLAKSAAALLADYRAKGNLPLRSYTFAVMASGALQDDKGLLAAANELRAQVREAGLLHGSIQAVNLHHLQKMSTGSTPPNRIEGTPDGGLVIDCVRTCEYIEPSLVITGEYEVRARISRAGDPEMGSAVGIVVAGNAEDDWTLVGIDEHGRIGVWVAELTGKLNDSRGTVLNRTGTFFPKPIIDPALPQDVAVHVDLEGHMVIKVGNCEPVTTKLALDASVARHVGVFAKNGVVTFNDEVVEMFP